MAVITGLLQDFGGNPLNGVAARIVFSPSGPALQGSGIFTTRPQYAYPATDGSFSIQLIENGGLHPATWYNVWIEHLDVGTNYVRRDDLIWQLIVPSGGGPIGDLIAAPIQTFQVWVVAGGTEPLGSKSGDFIFNPINDDFLRIN